MSDCLFCAIGAGDIPSEKLWDDEDVYAIRDIAPKAPVHILVIPKAHIVSAADITPENAAIVARCFCVIAELARREGIEQGGYRVVTNSGANAGQAVPHLHFHLLGGRVLGGDV